MGIEYFFIIIVIVCAVIAAIGWIIPAEAAKQHNTTNYNKIYEQLNPKEI